MSLIDFKKIILRPFGFNFIARYVGNNPTSESIEDGEVVIVGSRSYQKWAYLKCPCGCGNTTMLSLSTKRRPSWSVHLNWMMIPTVYPSVRDVGSCYAHYWIKKGKIHWCRDTGIKYTEENDYEE